MTSVHPFFRCVVNVLIAVLSASAHFAGENLKQREVKSLVQGHIAGQWQGQSGSKPQSIMASWELQGPAAETSDLPVP